MSEDTGFECPHCKRKGFVRLHSDSDVFECLYCRYTEDLTKNQWSDDATWFFAGLLGIFVTLMLLAAV